MIYTKACLHSLSRCMGIAVLACFVAVCYGLTAGDSLIALFVFLCAWSAGMLSVAGLATLKCGKCGSRVARLRISYCPSCGASVGGLPWWAAHCSNCGQQI